MNTSVATLQLSDITIEVIHKQIKHVHLSVYPPHGRVKVSAPVDMALDNIRLFVISKLAWVKQQQKKLQAQEREAPREYLPRESHYFRGHRYLLEIVEKDAKPRMTLTHKKMVLQVRPDTDQQKKQQLVDEWYRDQLKKTLVPLISHWEGLLGVSVNGFTVRRMKTKWGSCSPDSRTIRINLELAKKPPECLEYIVVHELAHLLEPNHGQRFVQLMDKHLPLWRSYRETLNALPVQHVEWGNNDHCY